MSSQQMRLPLHPPVPSYVVPVRREQTIGSSEEGRPIIVNHLGSVSQTESTPLRVLVIGGQHGDERAAIEAVDTFASSASHAPWQQSLQDGTLQLALLPRLNPDGASVGQRSNAKNVDLNRDHQLLRSAETQALHCFVRTWQPHLIVDVHTYPPRRRHLLAQGLVYCHDLFVDGPTNPAIAQLVRTVAHEGLLEPLLRRMNRCGLRSTRYTLINRPRKGRPGRVRHSTPDVIDVRNGLALRYNIPTLLLEGRGPQRRNVRGQQTNTAGVLQQALEQVIRLAQTQRTRLVASITPSQPGDPIPLRTRYRPAAEPCTMLFADADRGHIREVRLPGKYTPDVDVVETSPLPVAYAVPNRCDALLALLHRHGFVVAETSALSTAEKQHILDVQQSRHKGRAPRSLRLLPERVRLDLDEHTIFPLQQPGGRALALWLEPASKYALLRFAELGLSLRSHTSYPILRVLH